MRPQYSGRIAEAGFDGSSIFFYLGLTRGEIPPRAPPGLGVIRQIVYRGIALGRRGVYGYSINTELRSQGATPRRTPRIGVFHTNVRNQDKDYAGYPQAHRASLRTVALIKYARRAMFF